MMKKLFTLFMLAVFFATGVLAVFEESHSYDTRTVIRADDYFYKGEYNEMFVITRNTGYGELEDLRVSVSIPELGMWDVRSYFDLKTGDALMKMFDFYIPMDAAEGVYTMRVTIQNDELRTVQHRYFTVI